MPATTPGRGRRCGHPMCSDCATRRGRNRGNRAVRRAGKREARAAAQAPR